MKSVRKVLFLLLIFAALASGNDDDFRARFLYTYYSGDFLKAHQQLSNAFSDSILKQIWEERIHQNGTIEDCEYKTSSLAGTRGFAMLKAGDIEQAVRVFQDDWLSLLGKSTISTWKNDPSSARQYALEGLKLAPERPEPYYFAGNVSQSTDESTRYFLKFLELVKEDPYRKQIVEYSIEFMNRTRGMELNVPAKLEGFEELESTHKKGQLLVKASIDGGKKISLLVDTGAGGLTLKDKKWNSKVQTDLLMFGIGKKPVSKGARVVLTTFDSGRFSVKHPVASISAGLGGDGFDGIVGTAFFSSGNIIMVPMKSGRKFTLFNSDSDFSSHPKLKNFREKTELPFICTGKMIMIKGKIRNSPELDFLLDTGAERTIISTLAAKKYARINYLLSRTMKSNLTGVGGPAEDVLIAENVSIQAGPLRKDYNIISVLNLAEGSESLELEIDGILGRDILEGYTMLIDYRKRTVIFLR